MKIDKIDEIIEQLERALANAYEHRRELINRQNLNKEMENEKK